jgi:hypothetical protein
LRWALSMLGPPPTRAATEVYVRAAQIAEKSAGAIAKMARYTPANIFDAGS